MPGERPPRSTVILASHRWVPPAGFEPALTAPEAVAVHVPQLRKRARGCPSRACIGRGQRGGIFRPIAEDVSRMTADTNTLSNKAGWRSPPSVTWADRDRWVLADARESSE